MKGKIIEIPFSKDVYLIFMKPGEQFAFITNSGFIGPIVDKGEGERCRISGIS
jgi:hypothetical protein